MALATDGQPTPEEQLGINLVTSLESIFGLSADKTKEFVTAFVTAKTAESKQEILAQIAVKEGDLATWKATMEAFKSAIDKADLTEDGQINLEASIRDVFLKLGANKADIDAIKPKVVAFETALNSEITNRIAMGDNLTTLINNAKNSVDSLATRVSNVEATANTAKEYIDGVKHKATGLQERVTTKLNSTFVV